MSWQKYHMPWWKKTTIFHVQSDHVINYQVQLDRVWLKMLKHLIYIFLKDFWRLQNVTNCDKMTQCTWGLLCSITFDKSTSVKIVKFDSVKIIKFVKKSSQFVIYQIWWTSAYRLRVNTLVGLNYLHDEQTWGHSKACFWCKIIWNHHSHSDCGHFVFCSVFHASYFIDGCDGFSIWTIYINFDA